MFGFIRGLADGQRVFVWVIINEENSRRSLCLASSALLLYRNALIDIPEVLINKRTHSFLTLMGFALLVSFFWPLIEFAKDFVGERGGKEMFAILFFFFLSLNRFVYLELLNETFSDNVAVKEFQFCSLTVWRQLSRRC